MEALLKLAERCEMAAGPDRELDNAIANATRLPLWHGEPRYTASLDAALTLVPEGCLQPSDIVREALNRLGAHFGLHMMHWPLVTPYTDYLARFVCAAALRTRASDSRSKPDRATTAKTGVVHESGGARSAIAQGTGNE